MATELSKILSKLNIENKSEDTGRFIDSGYKSRIGNLYMTHHLFTPEFVIAFNLGKRPKNKYSFLNEITLYTHDDTKLKTANFNGLKFTPERLVNKASNLFSSYLKMKSAEVLRVEANHLRNDMKQKMNVVNSFNALQAA